MTLKKTLLIVLLFSNINVFAQREKGDVNLVIQPQIFFPTSEIKQTNGISLGGYISFEKMISEKLAFIASFGGGLMQGKKYILYGSEEDTYPAITLAQLRLGIKYFIYENHLWTSALIGGAQSFRQGANSFGFSFSPAIGYAINDNFDVAFRYDASIFKDYSIDGIGFNLGYHLGD